MDEEAMNKLLAAIRGAPPVLWSQLGVDGPPTHGMAIVPEGYKAIELQAYLPAPPWVRQHVELTHPDSFTEYVTRFDVPGRTVVFADETQGAFTAVMDYHAGGDVTDARGQGAHVASYACPLTENWKQWNGQDGRALSQVQLARFIERNFADIFQPSAADMLQLALNLDVHKSAVYESGLRLDNGQRQFHYTEEIRGSTRPGDITMPDVFVLKLPIFLDGPLLELLARFRYSLKDGVLSLSYELVNPQEAFRQAAKQVTAIIKTGLPGTPLWLGSRTPQEE